jgi:hypothetical protein
MSMEGGGCPVGMSPSSLVEGGSSNAQFYLLVDLPYKHLLGFEGMKLFLGSFLDPVLYS